MSQYANNKFLTWLETAILCLSLMAPLVLWCCTMYWNISAAEKRLDLLEKRIASLEKEESYMSSYPIYEPSLCVGLPEGLKPNSISQTYTVHTKGVMVIATAGDTTSPTFPTGSEIFANGTLYECSKNHQWLKEL